MKSFIGLNLNTEIHAPFKYIDLALARILHKYWKIRDATKSLMFIRAKKSREDLENIADVSRSILNILRVTRISKQ
ncbi:MAG: hypothetical protein QW101_04675 [Ignisphaera sp.]|uniref:Uncharacterized protein n=1 Tax=Ignisphaera aggregans TaxID=334771 RepID=A0A7J3MXJ6_9CREN